MSRMIPIHKPKKDKKNLHSYRPINNLNVVEKIVESIVKFQVVKFVEDNKILHENMHGSRKKHSVVTAKLQLDEYINNNKDKGNKVAVLSTDLSSAYDTVEHKLLLAILEHLGFRNNTNNYLKVT